MIVSGLPELATALVLGLAPVQTIGGEHADRPDGSHARSMGSVALMSRPFVLDEATAKELCPDGSRLRIVVGALDATSIDALATLGSPTPSVAVDESAAFAGDDRELAKRAASAHCLVLEGGSWSSWWRLLEPSNKRTRLGQVVVERHARGGSVIGVGAAGAYLCAYSLLSRAEMQVQSRDPHDLRQHAVVTGLGLVRGACFDASMDGRTTVEPLLEALRSSRIEACVWLSGSCAWIQRGDEFAARVAGPDGGAFVFDLGAGRRSRDATFGGKALRLAPGDRFEGLSADRGGGLDPVAIGDTAPLDTDLGGFPRNRTSAADKSRNSRKPIDLRGKTSSLRLFPEPDAGLDVTSHARAPRPDWIRFDWIPITSSVVGARIEPQVASSQNRVESGGASA